jgi:twitching motility protein PilT
VLNDLILENRGLILITGATGTGKSTTVASMIDALNHSAEGRKIVTVEDPIEYLHRDDVCLIYQREIGPDSHSFGHALRHVLRQDPDIIMVGEIRDLETLNISLMAANTGHLVLSTLHTADSVQTINRILSNYAPHEQDEVRHTLADNLRAVISQRLVRRISGKGRVAAVEVMIMTDTIKDFIVDGNRTTQIRQAIQEGVTQYRMQSFDQALAALVARGEISTDEAIRNATRPHELALHIQGFSGAGSRGWGPNTVAEASEKTPPPPDQNWFEKAA